MTLKVLFEPRDLWVGLYWTAAWEGHMKVLTMYFCVVPMLPVRISMVIGSLLRRGGANG